MDLSPIFAHYFINLTKSIKHEKSNFMRSCHSYRIATAQKESAGPAGVNVSGGVTLGLPIGDLADVASFGIGGFLKAGFPVSDQFEIVGNGGYTSFIGKTVDGDKFPSQGLFHILAGGSYLASENFHIDALGGLNSYSISGFGSTSGFGYRAGFGYKTEGGLDVTLNYNGFSKDGGTISYIGLGIAYIFTK